MSQQRHRLWIAAAVALVVTFTTIAGCRAPEVRWSTLNIPGRGSITTLANSPQGLIVGRVDEAASPKAGLQLYHPDGHLTPIPMVSGDADYATTATITMVAASDQDLIAIGGVRAGAHQNTRWTIWRGSTDGVHEQPQTFETFGGWGAGTITGAIATPSGPLLVGSWAGQSSTMDIATWSPTGERWVRSSTQLVSASDPTHLPTAAATTAAGTIYVVVGWVTTLGDPIRDLPTLWYSGSPDGDWHPLPLPVPANSTITRAMAVDCNSHLCAVTGRTPDQLVLWSVPIDQGAAAQPTLTSTAATPENIDTAHLLVALSHDGAVIAASEHEGTCIYEAGPAPLESPQSLLPGTPVGLARLSKGLALATDDHGVSTVWAQQ